MRRKTRRSREEKRQWDGEELDHTSERARINNQGKRSSKDVGDQAVTLGITVP